MRQPNRPSSWIAVGLALALALPSCSSPTESPASLSAHLVTPPLVRAGTSTVFTLVVVNTSGQEYANDIHDGASFFEPLVTTTAGEVVYDARYGLDLLTSGELRIAPGDSVFLTSSWNARDQNRDPVPPGSYLLSGRVFTADGELIANSTSPVVPLTISAQ